MTIRCIKLALCLLFFTNSFAQITPTQSGEKWDLRKCVDYALANNISIKQAALQIPFAQLDLTQSKLQQYPNLSFGGNMGYSSGRNQDPTTFSLITTGYVFNNYSLQTSVDLFNWFTKRNTTDLKDLNLQVSKAGLEKAMNDIGFNVAVAYLQVLLAKEQANLVRIQAAETKSQLENTRKQVDAGKLPELSAAQLESQLATDSSNLISAETSADQLLLSMKALLNLDPALPFDVVTPTVDKIPIDNLADLMPDKVYVLALTNLPQQKLDELNVKAAAKSVEIAKGSMYPTFSLFGSLGSTYNNKAKEIKSKTQVNSAIGSVTVGSTAYQVYPLSPFDVFTYGKMSYFDQLNQNFRQSVGISVNVPLFNGGNLRSGWLRSKLTLKQTQLQQDQNTFTLKQNIYKAYSDAVAAMQKFNANKKAVEILQKTYDYAKKRYDVDLLSTYELITSQTNLLVGKSQLVYSQYDYVFKMKLLEFYKGQGIKLE
ncbi:MAG: TolC family protein [Chitinophagales bacterium]